MTASIQLTDYYEGVEGAHRWVKELDYFLQHAVNHIGGAEALDCAIEFRVSGGESIGLKKVYRAQRADDAASSRRVSS